MDGKGRVGPTRTPVRIFCFSLQRPARHILKAGRNVYYGRWNRI